LIRKRQLHWPQRRRFANLRADLASLPVMMFAIMITLPMASAERFSSLGARGTGLMAAQFDNFASDVAPVSVLNCQNGFFVRRHRAQLLKAHVAALCVVIKSTVIVPRYYDLSHRQTPFAEGSRIALGLTARF
jgi:hypothetical protein